MFTVFVIIVNVYCSGCIAELSRDLPAVRNVKIVPGVGIEGWVQLPEDDDDWRHVAVGNDRLLKSNGGTYRNTKI